MDKKIAIIIGTKAELIKCMPIMLELQKQKRDYWFIHTGQHPLGKNCEELNVKKPDFILSKEPDISTKFWGKITLKTFIWNLKTMFTIRRIIRKLNPKYVLFHGDTMNTAMAIGASAWVLNPFKKWKTVHLEAGLRSGSLKEPLPEEFIRRVADRFSDILLAVSDLTENNLKKNKKIKGKIIKVGNTIVDSAQIIYESKKKNVKKLPRDYVLINLHRHENLKSKKRMTSLVNILQKIKINALWPLHDNTEYYLKKYGLMEKIKAMKNIKIMPLTDYATFIFLLANCKYLITDGGSIQEESLVFKKPCLILRNKTERQEGLSTGINFLTKLNINIAKKVIELIENDKLKIKKFKNPYGKKGISKRICEILT